MYVRADTGLSAKAADPCLLAANWGGSGNGCGPLQACSKAGQAGSMSLNPRYVLKAASLHRACRCIRPVHGVWVKSNRPLVAEP
jgi:hypothetical protein